MAVHELAKRVFGHDDPALQARIRAEAERSGRTPYDVIWAAMADHVQMSALLLAMGRELDGLEYRAKGDGGPDDPRDH